MGKTILWFQVVPQWSQFMVSYSKQLQKQHLHILVYIYLTAMKIETDMEFHLNW